MIPYWDPTSPQLTLHKNCATSTKVRCAFLDYVDLCEGHSAKYPSLDEMLVGWAKWSVSANDLYDTPEERAECLLKRSAKAGEDHKIRSMPATSFTTYLNDLARVYKRSAGTLPVVTISPLRQFPRLNQFLCPVVSRSKGKRVARWSGEPEDNVVTDAEIQKYVEGVKYDQPFMVQRRNVLCIGNATGFRGEVLRRLLVESVKPTTLGNKKAYSIVVATMKNMPGGLNEGYSMEG